MTQYRWRLLSLAFLTAAAVHLSMFSYSLLITEIMAELNITHVQAGSIFSMSMLAIAFVRIPWGALVDRVGFVWVMRGAALLISISVLLRGIVTDYGTLLMVQLLLGIGLGATMPSISKLVTTCFQQDKRGFATGICVSGYPVGGLSAYLSTQNLLQYTGSWRQVFIVHGGGILVLAVLWWAFTPKYSISGKQQSSVSIDAFTSLLRLKETWALTGLLIVTMGVYDTLSTWLPYILSTRALSHESIGSIVIMMPAGFFTASLTVGGLSDRLGRRRPFILLLGLVSGLVVFGVYSSGNFLLWVTTFLTGFCTVGILTLILEIPTEVPEIAGLEGSAVGLISSFGNIGPFLFPMVVGFIRDSSGSFFLAILFLAITSEVIPILGLVIRETGKRQSSVNLDLHKRHRGN